MKYNVDDNSILDLFTNIFLNKMYTLYVYFVTYERMGEWVSKRGRKGGGEERERERE